MNTPSTYNREQVGSWNGKSIPTFYAGHTFRSRTEARWAVFMDQLGVRWHYEHEGFQLPSGWYLPDFWIPSIGTYLEIKPSVYRTGDYRKEHVEAVRKCSHLSDVTKQRVILFCGSPGEQVDGLPDGPDYYGGEMLSPSGYDEPYYWCVCPACGATGIEFDGRGARICGGVCKTDGHPDKGYSYNHPNIRAAYQAAESWRFA